MIPVSSSIDPKQIFLDWRRPVVDLAAEYLLSQVKTDAVSWIDLSNLLVVVPTRNAGRRLREALALAVEKSGGGAGLLPPQLRVPEDFLSGENASNRVASSTAAQLAWIEQLKTIDLDDYEVLFPVKPPEQSFSWASKVASELAHARSALAEGGLLARDLPNGEKGDELPERERWLEIARLEGLVIEALDQADLQEPEAAKIITARSWQVPDDAEKIILMALPDPLQLAIDAVVAGVGKSAVELEVCIHAPASMAEAFDQWGRPQAEFWQRRILTGLKDDHIFLAADAEGQTQAVLNFLRSRRDQTRMGQHAVAVGSADSDVVPVLKQALLDAGVQVFDPDGEPFRKHSLYHFLDNFCKLLRDGRYQDFLELLRNPTWLDSLAKRFEAMPSLEVREGQDKSYFDPAGVLQAFDSLYERVLPGSLDEAMQALRRDRERDESYHRPLAGQWVVGDAVAGLLENFKKQSFAQAFGALLEEWLGGRQVRADEAEALLLPAVAERSCHLAEEMSQVLGGKTNFDPADLFDLILQSLASLRYYPGDRHASDLELQGWLELPWESADDLVISGFNDGLVPAAVVGDMFLPESARNLLALKSNEQRFARDLYLLESMLGWRLQGDHSVQVVVGKVTSTGDLLKPSRLLFQCVDEDLPQRALRLFAGDADASGAEKPVSAWNLSWKLQPPFDREYLLQHLPKTISATSFSGFLACPFRFILKRMLRMEEVNCKKMEMDARDFGNLCHRALEVLSAGSSLAEEASYDLVYQALVDSLHQQVKTFYGEQPSATILLQAEVASNRLQLAARHHVAALKDGWEVVATEKVFGKEDGGWLLAGMPVTGTIDRIEKNEAGCYRLIDYKTSSKASSAFEAHLQPLPRGKTEQDYPEWLTYELPENGKIYRWVNLQLPVYALWAEQHLAAEAGKGLVDCAYVNLPKALSEGGYDGWPGGMDSVLLRSARACAVGVIEQVQKGHFWPPADKVKYDDFKSLGFPNFIDSLDLDAFAKVFADADFLNEGKGEHQ